jgi:peptidoglycan/LPS O-acetylase OafA/YrhL
MTTASPQTIHRRAPSSHSTFRPDIEGLRGIAVLMVVLYHVGVPGSGGGFTGVDVFFVLSGYLITDLLVKEFGRTGKIDFFAFYARRARRLLPAAVLVLAVTVLAGAVLLSPLEQRQYARSAMATAIYLSNLFFLRETTDYFAADSAHDPFLHTWSLAVEEQFYLVWPLLIVLGLGVRGSRGRLKLLISAVCVVSFVACIWLTLKYKPVAFFGSPLRAWEFGIGGLATLLPVAAMTARAGRCRALGWAGLLGILLSGALVSGDLGFPGPSALLPAVATVMALVAGVGAPGQGVGVVLGSAPLQHLGRLSYSWYLWHWPVLAFIAASGADVPMAGRLLGAAGALAAAAAAYALVENRIRFHPALVPRPKLTLGLAGALSLAGVTLALGAGGYARWASSGPRQQAITAAVGDNTALQDNKCVVGFTGRGVRECVFGDTLSAVTVVLFGDSHAEQWFTALEPVAQERRWRLVTMVKAGCAVGSVPVYSAALGRRSDECAAWRREAIRRIIARSPDLIVAANSIGYVIRPGRPDGYSRLTPEEWRDGNRRTLAALDSAGLRTVLLRDSPRPVKHVPTCLSRAEYRGRDEAECISDRSIAVDDAVFAVERQAAAGLRHVSLLDLSDLFCGPDRCDPVKDSLVIYRDASHMTASYAKTLAPALSQRLGPLVSAAALTN